MKQKMFALVAALLFLAAAHAQTPAAPVSWKWSFRMTSAGSGEAVFKAVMAPGWHLYASDAQDVPAPLEISFDEVRGMRPDGRLTADRKPSETYDEALQTRQTWWSDSVTIVKKFDVTDGGALLGGTIRYSACDNSRCMPPKTVRFSLRVPRRDTRQDRASRPE